MSVAAHSPDEILPATLATLREINRKPKAELLDIEPDDDEIELYTHEAPWENDTSTGYVSPNIFGDDELKAELKMLCDEFQDIFSTEV